METWIYFLLLRTLIKWQALQISHSFFFSGDKIFIWFQNRSSMFVQCAALWVSLLRTGLACEIIFIMKYNYHVKKA